MAEQEEDVQRPTQLRVLSIVKSPPQLKPHLLYKQPSVHPILHVPPQPLPLRVQWPAHVDIGPQPLPQEVMQTLVHTPEQAELPQPWLQLPKHPPAQLAIKHKLEHESAELRLLPEHVL